jgi:5-methylcytosine-specific restriction endonuclease McrA
MRASGQFERNGARGRRSACKDCRREAWAANAARRRAAGVAKVPAGVVKRLLAKQQGTCNSCRHSLLGVFHVDHIVAIAKGGRHEESNLQLLCPRCNLRKGAK